MAVRLHAEWMSRGDERLLEYLEIEGATPARVVAEDDRIQLSRPHANLRLKRLSRTDLVTDIGNGVYEITDAGEAYLHGDLDARDLSPPEN